MAFHLVFYELRTKKCQCCDYIFHKSMFEYCNCLSCLVLRLSLLRIELIIRLLLLFVSPCKNLLLCGRQIVNIRCEKCAAFINRMENLLTERDRLVMDVDYGFYQQKRLSDSTMVERLLNIEI